MKFGNVDFNAALWEAKYNDLPQTIKTELIKSGALSEDASLKALFGGAQGGTHYATRTFSGNLDDYDGVVNYDGNTDITEGSTDTYTQGVIALGRAKGWKEKDFVKEITGAYDPVKNIQGKVSNFWDIYRQRYIVLPILKGIFSMSDAQGKKFIASHTYDITANSGTAAYVGADSLNNAITQASGDARDAYTITLMHSTVASHLESLKLLEYMTTIENGIERKLPIATWNGRTVLIDDSMPVTEVPESSSGKGDGYTSYTTYVLGDGAIGYCDLGVENPFSVARDEKTDGGVTMLYSRNRQVFAPKGISYKVSSKISPAQTDLETGSNWEIVNNGASTKKYFDSKAIYITKIVSRG